LELHSLHLQIVKRYCFIYLSSQPFDGEKFPFAGIRSAFCSYHSCCDTKTPALLSQISCRTIQKNCGRTFTTETLIVSRGTLSDGLRYIIKSINKMVNILGDIKCEIVLVPAQCWYNKVICTLKRCYNYFIKFLETIRGHSKAINDIKFYFRVLANIEKQRKKSQTTFFICFSIIKFNLILFKHIIK